MGDSIRELHDLYAEAIQVPEGAPTAQKLGPCTGRNFKLGRLLITSISLKDDGLRGGGKDVVLGTMTEYIPDPVASREMEGLGLPTDFGEDKQVSSPCMQALVVTHACRHFLAGHLSCDWFPMHAIRARRPSAS